MLDGSDPKVDGWPSLCRGRPFKPPLCAELPNTNLHPRHQVLNHCDSERISRVIAPRLLEERFLSPLNLPRANIYWRNWGNPTPMERGHYPPALSPQR